MCLEQLWDGVFWPVKAQQLNVISCNRIGVTKASTQDIAEHHFEIEKKCEDFSVKEILKKMYMIDFNKPSLKDEHLIIWKFEGISIPRPRRDVLDW